MDKGQPDQIQQSGTRTPLSAQALEYQLRSTSTRLRSPHLLATIKFGLLSLPRLIRVHVSFKLNGSARWCNLGFLHTNIHTKRYEFLPPERLTRRR